MADDEKPPYGDGGGNGGDGGHDPAAEKRYLDALKEAAKQAGVQVVSADLTLAVKMLCTGQPLSDVANMTLWMLGSICRVSRRLHEDAERQRFADYLEKRETSSTAGWEAARADFVAALDAAKAILLDEDWQAASARYELLGEPVGRKQ